MMQEQENDSGSIIHEAEEVEEVELLQLEHHLQKIKIRAPKPSKTFTVKSWEITGGAR